MVSRSTCEGQPEPSTFHARFYDRHDPKDHLSYFWATICTSLSSLLTRLIHRPLKYEWCSLPRFICFQLYTGGAIHNVGRFILLIGRADFQEILRVEFLNPVPLHICCVVELRVYWFHIKMLHMLYYMRNLNMVTETVRRIRAVFHMSVMLTPVSDNSQ